MAGIYIHIPFCDTKCIYCDFYSITDHARKNELIDCIINEIQILSPKLHSKKFETIFFGGGTPSLLSLNDFERLFDTIYSNLNIEKDSEITIEANPGTLDKNKLVMFRKLPVNRISFGVQSFIDSELKFLTRIHDSEQAIGSIKSAQDSGFDNINLDLIFAIPGQTLEAWKYNLLKALNLNTKHISAYSLIFEEGTPLFSLFKQKKVSQAKIDLEREMYDYTMEYLPLNGYQQYEVSNYANPGYECKHNLQYWEHKEYIGFGPSAASYIDNYRQVNIRDIGKYIDKIKNNKNAADFTEFIDNDTSIYEYIMLGLRSRGVDFNTFRKNYKLDFRTKYSQTIEILINAGLAQLTQDNLRLTPKGYAVCDEILATYF
ncbi:MAG: radical SAM family heme chaperone HemW [Ignavibacteria bacterium]